MTDPSYPLAELCLLADLQPRTVRYYVQIGLVDRPQGETRAARYGSTRLEQSLLIKKLAHGRVSKTKDGAIQLTLKVYCDEGVNISETIAAEAEIARDAIVEYQLKR